MAWGHGRVPLLTAFLRALQAVIPPPQPNSDEVPALANARVRAVHITEVLDRAFHGTLVAKAFANASGDYGQLVAQLDSSTASAATAGQRYALKAKGDDIHAASAAWPDRHLLKPEAATREAS